MGGRTYPFELLKLERKLVRTQLWAPERSEIAEQIKRFEVGRLGEEAVAKHLQGLRLPGMWTLFRDVRLHIREDYVSQFDFIVQTEKVIIILEAKRVKGELTWRENPRRLERIREDGTLLTMDCPLTQVENQITALSDWLSQRGLYLPVIGVAVFTLRNTWFNLPEGAKVISVKELRSYITRRFHETSPPGPQHTPFQTLRDRILAEQLGPDWMITNAPVNRDRIRTGLICEHCHTNMHQRICGNCKRKAETDPLEMALLDFLILIRQSITNSDFRSFSGLQSSSTAQRCLNRYELDAIGNNKGRIYGFNVTRHLKGKRLIRKKHP